MKSITNIEVKNIRCYPSSTKPVILSYCKDIRLVEHNFPFINPCCPILPWHPPLPSAPISWLSLCISCVGEPVPATADKQGAAGCGYPRLQTNVGMAVTV